MKALVYKGPQKLAVCDKSKPALSGPNDAIIKITHTTICGTDLHILKGDVPTVQSGRTLGHEGVGVIDEVGSAVTQFKVGDRVLISCISSCSKCSPCRKGMYSHCVNGGWMLGHLIDGTQAEYVRIPHADTSLYKLPENFNAELFVMLSDILPTGFECGVLNGRVAPGSSVAIVGAGPIGLASLLTGQFYAPAKIIMIDPDDYRLERAKSLGATHCINDKGKSLDAIREEVLSLTDGQGVETAMEAVGIPETFSICEAIVAPGGVIANIGVHGKKVDFHLEKLWSQNITITTRLVDTVTTAMLLSLVEAKKVDPSVFITHRFKLSEIEHAYEAFGKAAENHALKVIIANDL